MKLVGRDRVSCQNNYRPIYYYKNWSSHWNYGNIVNHRMVACLLLYQFIYIFFSLRFLLPLINVPKSWITPLKHFALGTEKNVWMSRSMQLCVFYIISINMIIIDNCDFLNLVIKADTYYVNFRHFVPTSSFILSVSYDTGLNQSPNLESL